jgi:hypothetical protein
MNTVNPHDSIILVQDEPRGPSQLVEIPVTVAQSRIAFPDIQQLRALVNQNIIIKQMRLITLEVLTNGVITGYPNAPITELQKITLLLYCEGWEKGQYIPILTLNDTTIPGGTFTHRYHETRFNNWQKVDWSKSYLQYANGTVAVPGETGYCVMLDIQYLKFDADGKEIIGPS